MEYKKKIEVFLFARLLQLNNEHFDYTACNFREKNMHGKDKSDGKSKEGSGRVALFRASNLEHCYTLECNYNKGKLMNILYDKGEIGIENSAATNANVGEIGKVAGEEKDGLATNKE